MKVKKKKFLTEEEKLVAARSRADARLANVNQQLERFHFLPDEAHVRLPVVMALYGCSAATVWRNVAKGLISAPTKFGARVSAWNVGKLRSDLSA